MITTYSRLGALILMLGLFTAGMVQGQGDVRDWSWFGQPFGQTGLRRVAIGDDGTVLVIGSGNIYRGPLGGTGVPLLDWTDFMALGSEARFVHLADGTLLVAGGPASVTTSGIVRFATPSADPELIAAADLDSTLSSGSFGPDDLTALDESTVVFKCTYSFDAGRTWYRMRNAAAARVHDRHVQRIGDSIYALNAQTKTWYVVDTTRREFVPSSLDGNYCRFALLQSGAGLAIRHGAGDEVELQYRSSGSAAWSPLPQLTDDDGVIVNASRSIAFRASNLLLTHTNTAIYFLDSARILEYDGSTFTVRTISSDLRSATIARNATLVDGDSIVRIVYELQRPETALRRTYHAVEYSLADGSLRVIDAGRRVPIDITANGILYDTPAFRENESDLLRPVLRTMTIDGYPADQPRVIQVGMAAGMPFCVSVDGAIHGLDTASPIPARLQVSMSGLTGMTESQQVMQRTTILGRPDSTVLVPGSIVATGGYAESSYAVMPSISTSGSAACAAYDATGTLTVGHRELVRRDGNAWTPLVIPTNIRDSGIIISSILPLSTNTLFVSLRGYGVGSSTEENFTMKRGGIARTTDGGSTWTSVPLPRDEQWVENLTLGPDGHIYCWATTMVMDTAYGRLPSDPRPRHGSAHLYRSSDQGATWDVVYTDEVDEQERRNAVAHQWSISFSPSGAIAINTPFEVLTAPRVGEAFTPVEDLPPNAAIGGVVFDAAGDLWIGTRFGVHRRSLTPTSVSDNTGANTATSANIVLRAMPNPATNGASVRLELTNAHGPLPDHITITSLDGSITARIPRIGSAFVVDTSTMPAGVYTATATHGHTVVSTMIVIM